MLRIGICDDDIKTTSIIEDLLYELLEPKQVRFDISVFFDGVDLEKSILRGERYDLIYLDIEMKIHNGLTTAKTIREHDCEVLIYYVSNHDSYLKQLFEVQPLGFIDKPINRTLFSKYFGKAYQLILSRDNFLEFRFNKMFYKIPLSRVVYFESKKRAIIVHMNDNTTYTFYEKLNTIEQTIEDFSITFLRIHQSYYVNQNYILIKKPTQVILQSNQILPISEERQKEINNKYVKKLRMDLFNE